MVRFLRTLDGLVNVDRIARIDSQSCAVICDGSRSPVVDDITTIDAPVVAAAPGFVCLRYRDEEHGGPGVERTPIVAWRIMGNVALPIVVPGDNVEDSNCVGSGVLMPDGQVIQPRGARFPNETLWREQMERQAKARRDLALEKENVQ